MKTLTFAVVLSLGLSAFAFDDREMIGRCSYDNQTSMDGFFRRGFVVANFYVAGGRVFVAEGVSLVDGSIRDRLDRIRAGGRPELDQGVLWPVYEVMLNPGSTRLNFSGSWIDNLARKLNPTAPPKSTFVYATRELGVVVSSPLIAGSFLQNNLGQPNGYPACVFWESPIAR